MKTWLSKVIIDLLFAPFFCTIIVALIHHKETAKCFWVTGASERTLLLCFHAVCIPGTNRSLPHQQQSPQASSWGAEALLDSITPKVNRLCNTLKYPAGYTNKVGRQDSNHKKCFFSSSSSLFPLLILIGMPRHIKSILFGIPMVKGILAVFIQWRMYCSAKQVLLCFHFFFLS